MNYKVFAPESMFPPDLEIKVRAKKNKRSNEKYLRSLLRKWRACDIYALPNPRAIIVAHCFYSERSGLGVTSQSRMRVVSCVRE